MARYSVSTLGFVGLILLAQLFGTDARASDEVGEAWRDRAVEQKSSAFLDNWSGTTLRGRYRFQLAQSGTNDDDNLEDLGLDDLNEGNELDDPIEPLNRFVFAINDAIDTIILRPLVGIYSFVTPVPAKKALRKAFRNLNEPVVFANKLLQAEFSEAGIVLGRLAVNSTVGVAGLFEVAEDWGMPRQQADFGQTLFRYGVGPGPYVVLPLLGPSSLRHAGGRGVDTLLHPRTYFLPTGTNLALTGGQVAVIREQLIEPLDQLKESSIDYYSALRSAYYQNRLKTTRGEQAEDEFDVGGGPKN